MLFGAETVSELRQFQWQTWALKQIICPLLRECLHDTGATFAPERVHSGSLSWLYICLHDTTTNFMSARVTPGREFHSGTKSRNRIM